MARKNRNVRSRNTPRNLVQLPKRRPPISLEGLVLPDGQCRFQNPRRPKARFATLEKAEKALRQAQYQRERSGSLYMERRVYACPEGGCGGYHLTSRESWRD